MKITGYEVIEFFGNGDPWFGGTADDLPLGTNGRFGRYFRDGESAVFPTIEAAESAAAAAPNKRPGGNVSVIPIRDYSDNR